MNQRDIHALNAEIIYYFQIITFIVKLIVCGMNARFKIRQNAQLHLFLIAKYAMMQQLHALNAMI